MFYKSSSRSTVLNLHNSHRQDPVPAPAPAEDDVLALADEFVEINRKAEAMKSAKLSAFEKDMLQAWAQD